MYIQNITFMVEPHMASNFIEWLIPYVKNCGGRLSTLRQVGGDSVSAEEAASFAYQEEFSSLEDLNIRYESFVENLTEAFTRKFQPNAIFFCSVSEVISIE